MKPTKEVAEAYLHFIEKTGAIGLANELVREKRFAPVDNGDYVMRVDRVAHFAHCLATAAEEYAQALRNQWRRKPRSKPRRRKP